MHNSSEKILSKLSHFTTIILVGGGTGGHVQPIISLFEHFKNMSGKRRFLWIGGKSSMEEEKAHEHTISFKSVTTTKLETTHSLKILIYPFGILKGFFEARKILNQMKGDNPNMCVFSKGGPGSIAVGLAARSLHIPLFIHESDTVPGRANRFIGRFATRVFLGFEEAISAFPKDKSEVIGQILHPAFFSNKPHLSRITWQTDLPHILVVCGSQGSQTIFDAILTQWHAFPKAEWIISLGRRNSHMKSQFLSLNRAKGANEGGYVQAEEWLSQYDLASLIQETDIGITRGSATTLAELTSTPQHLHKNPENLNQKYPHSLHLIIIPLPFSARNHQLENARVYEKMGHTLLEQKDRENVARIAQEIMRERTE